MENKVKIVLAAPRSGFRQKDVVFLSNADTLSNWLKKSSVPVNKTR